MVDGGVVAAAEEERFTRLKHDPALPAEVVRWLLEEHLREADLACVAFYSKPFPTLERILWSHGRAGFGAIGSLTRALGTWSRRKLWVQHRIESLVAENGAKMPRLAFVEHHLSHAASAYYPSPFDEAAIVTLDGVGEWSTASIGWGRGAEMGLVREQRYPDSIGLFYTAMTTYCGFDANDGESKLMGLAPFGRPTYADALADRVIQIGPDGSVALDQRWFRYLGGSEMTHPRLAEVLDGPPRIPEDPLTQREADIAASAQLLLERVVLRTAFEAHRLTGHRAVCLAGGVALNVAANRRLREDGPFDDVWIQPAPSDAGGSVGAALWAAHTLAGHPRPTPEGDGMSGALLGPSYGSAEIGRWLAETGVAAVQIPDRAELSRHVAGRIADGAVVGWFQGRMEFGPRALGSRSILGDPRDPTLVQRINLAVKGREGFRPFAPAVMAERCDDWFDLPAPSSYMLFTGGVLGSRPEEPEPGDSFAARLNRPRSPLPACTHVDGSARIQTVGAEDHPAFHQLLSAFDDLTGVPVLLNTSFNVRDEPIVRTPADAYRCFRRAGLDLLVLEDRIIERAHLDGGVPC